MNIISEEMLIGNDFSSMSAEDIKEEKSETSVDFKIPDQSFLSEQKTLDSEISDLNCQSVSKLLAQPHNLEDKAHRKLSIKSELAEYALDDEISTTTVSSLTYVSDTYISDSRTDTTTSEDDYLQQVSTSKLLTQAKDTLKFIELRDASKNLKTLVDKSCIRTSSKSELLQSDFSPDSNVSCAQETQYERSISFSDNAASDVSSECKFEEHVGNLPYDSEKEEHTTESITRSSSSLSKTQELNKNFKQLTSDSRVEHTSSPQSDVTEYTESVSIADSIIESIHLEKRIMEKHLEEKIPFEASDNNILSGKKKFRCTDIDLSQQPKSLISYKKTNEKKYNNAELKAISSSSISKTESSLKGISVTKSSSRKTNIVSKQQDDVEISTSSTSVTKTSSRVYGYMQSTVSRDRKIGKITHIAQRTSRSRNDSESRSVEKRSSSIDCTEKKEKHSDTVEFRKDFEVDAKISIQSQTRKSAKMTENKSKEQFFVKKSDAVKQKLPPAVVQSESDKSSSEKSASIVAMTKSLKDKKNSSLIPIKKEKQKITKIPQQQRQIISKKDDTMSHTEKYVVEKSQQYKSASITKSSKQVQKISVTGTKESDKMTVISRKKKKTERVPKSDSQESFDKVQKIENLSTSTKTPIITSSRTKKSRAISKTTKPMAVTTTTITQADITLRSQSAMYYANKDSITFEHGEIASSMPSSPSHVKRPNSSNGNNVITSEVFTRTVESPKSLEVIYRQPESFHSSKVKYISDVDASFIETTDSSLSDSIALPSSTSEQDPEMKKKSKPSPQSPMETKMPFDLVEGKSRKVDITPMKSEKDESDAVSPQRQKHKFSYEEKDKK
ncbi:uncharacterized protein [Chironomus tepperi]|uniref:uncharacterized protein isoform X2 n=1 Tax=Chironomus tepperi TaxID=113505 RepID=UPI00391F674A